MTTDTRQRRARERVTRRVEGVTRRVERSPTGAHGLAAFNRDRHQGGNLLAAALAFRMFAVLLPLALLVAVGLGYASTLDRSSPAEAGKAVGIGGGARRARAGTHQLPSETRPRLGS